jgi:hypothetical protein
MRRKQIKCKNLYGPISGGDSTSVANADSLLHKNNISLMEKISCLQKK